MLKNTPSKLNFRLSDLAKAALGIITVDGGFIIAVQIVSFLLSYFSAQALMQQQNLQAIPGINKANIIVIIMTMLNLSVIIFRTTGIARGMRYSLKSCYKQALKRLSNLILLYLLVSTILLLAAIPLMRIVGASTPDAIMQYYNLIMFCMLSLIPLAIFACVHVIDQENSPLQALKNTFYTVRDKVSIPLLMNLSLLYTVPFCLGTLVTLPSSLAPYIGLGNALWFLFCHVITIVVYVGVNTKVEVVSDKQKTTKVIVV